MKILLSEGTFSVRNSTDIGQIVGTLTEDFDANVSIKTCGNQPRYDGEDIPNSLPAVGRDTLIGKLVAVLALKMVDIEAVDHVAGVDK